MFATAFCHCAACVTTSLPHTHDFKFTLHPHLTVKASRAQQCLVQHIRAVGGGQHNDTRVALKAIHLSQQLVDGLLALIIATTQAGATLTADGINLINEDDARGLSLGLCVGFGREGRRGDWGSEEGVGARRCVQVVV